MVLQTFPHTTLDLHHKSPTAHWPDKIAVVPPAQPLIPPAIDPLVQQTVHEALIEETQLEVSYRKPDGQVHDALLLHPLGLIQRGPATYLAALTFHYDDVRLYALHRIQRARKQDLAARSLPGFQIDHYAEEQGHFGSGKPIRLIARVSERLKCLLEETRLAEDQTLTGPDETGRYTVTATVRDTWQLRWWVLGKGEDICDVSPKQLS